MPRLTKRFGRRGWFGERDRHSLAARGVRTIPREEEIKMSEEEFKVRNKFNRARNKVFEGSFETRKPASVFYDDRGDLVKTFKPDQEIIDKISQLDAEEKEEMKKLYIKDD